MAHFAPITTVDALQDGSLYATGSYDGQVILWNQKNEELWRFQAPHLVNLVRFDHKAERLAAAAADFKVYVFDVKTGGLCSVLGPFKDDANAVSWHPDNRHLAIVADTFDSDVHVMDVETGAETLTLAGHTDCVCNVAFNPNGSRLCTAAEDGTARIWDAKTGATLKVLEHPNDPESIAWSQDGRYIATGCNDGQVRLWCAESGEVIGTSTAAQAAVRYVKFAPDSKSLLAGSYDAHLRLLDLPSLEVKAVYEAPFQWERSSVMTRDAIMVASFGSHPIIFNLDGSVRQHAGRSYGINFLNVGNSAGRVIAGRDDGMVVDVLSGRSLYEHPSIVNVCKFSPDMRLIGSSDYAGHIKVFDVALGKVVAETRIPGGPVNALAWSPDGKHFATASYDGQITWWTPELVKVASKQAHHGPIKSMEWCPVSNILVAGSSDHSVSGHRYDETVFHTQDEGLSLVNSVALSPQEGCFFTASRDTILRKWDIKTGAVLERLPRAHFRSVKAVAYDPQSGRLLSGSYDGSAMLWHKENGHWIFRALQLHGIPGVPSVAFDHGVPLTAGWDGTVARWTVNGKLVSQYKVNEFELAA